MQVFVSYMATQLSHNAGLCKLDGDTAQSTMRVFVSYMAT
jgi:hypothetical protein